MKTVLKKSTHRFVPTLQDVCERRLLAINSGKWTTRREELFEPLETIDRSKYGFLGVLRDSVARELYSFSHELWAQSRDYARARKSRDAKEYERKYTLFSEFAKTAEDLFWKRLSLALSVPENEKSRLVIGKGWKVFREIESPVLPVIKPDLLFLHMPGAPNGPFSNV